MGLMFTYVAAQAQPSTTSKVGAIVFQVVAQQFHPHLCQALKIWGELLVAVAIKLTGDSTYDKKGGRLWRPPLHTQKGRSLSPLISRSL